MLWKRKRKWHRFDNGLIAINSEDALLLQQWYKSQVLASSIAGNFELIDLHRYKKITAKGKVKAAMCNPATTPFVFFVCLN
jgi:hypothetical protein